MTRSKQTHWVGVSILVALALYCGLVGHRAAWGSDDEFLNLCMAGVFGLAAIIAILVDLFVGLEGER